jgi:hypothetical protein
VSRRGTGRRLTALVGVVAGVAVVAGAQASPSVVISPNRNVSVLSGNDGEIALAVNPTNTSNVVVVHNETTPNTLRREYSTDGGVTWARGDIAVGVACCQPQAAFDAFGNLFVVYVDNSGTTVKLIVSTDGGATFGAPTTLSAVSGVDEPSVATGAGSVWVCWELGGSIQATGASVTGLGVIGAFGPALSPPSATGDFGGIAVGPAGQVTVTYQSPASGQGPETIYSNTDADGLGPGGFGARVTVTTTNVGGFDFIPAQPNRSVDAEANLAYDRSGGPAGGRLYLAYTDETPNESDNMDVYLRVSTNSGATWGAALRVNDDVTTRSQFLPALSVDQSTGNLAVTWEDARNDGGIMGSGSTDGTVNNDAMYYGAISTNGGVTFGANFQISAGVSSAIAAAGTLDYGDYSSNDYAGGKLYAGWNDNSNSTLDNPDGTLHAFDVYIAKITGNPTAVYARAFTATRSGGSVVLRWASGDAQAAAFAVYRVHRGRLTRVIRSPVVGMLGRSYRVVDRVGAAAYRLMAIEVDGSRRWVASAVTRP